MPPIRTNPPPGRSWEERWRATWARGILQWEAKVKKHKPVLGTSHVPPNALPSVLEACDTSVYTFDKQKILVKKQTKFHQKTTYVQLDCGNEDKVTQIHAKILELSAPNNTEGDPFVTNDGESHDKVMSRLVEEFDLPKQPPFNSVMPPLRCFFGLANDRILYDADGKASLGVRQFFHTTRKNTMKEHTWAHGDKKEPWVSNKAILGQETTGQPNILWEILNSIDPVIVFRRVNRDGQQVVDFWISFGGAVSVHRFVPTSSHGEALYRLVWACMNRWQQQFDRFKMGNWLQSHQESITPLLTEFVDKEKTKYDPNISFISKQKDGYSVCNNGIVSSHTGEYNRDSTWFDLQSILKQAEVAPNYTRECSDGSLICNNEYGY
jgi:hypothetical protein